MDVFTQTYFCMISDGGHAFRATNVLQADIKPQFYSSLWRLRRVSGEGVAQRFAISIQSIHAALPS